jgi:hypothetical protein
MNDRQVQDLIRGQFMNAIILRIIDGARANRGRVQQGQGVQYVHKVPLIVDIVCGAVVLFWVTVLVGTLSLSILGLIMLVFQID